MPPRHLIQHSKHPAEDQQKKNQKLIIHVNLMKLFLKLKGICSIAFIDDIRSTTQVQSYGVLESIHIKFLNQQPSSTGKRRLTSPGGFLFYPKITEALPSQIGFPFFFFFCCTTLYVGSQFPNQGLNSHPLCWECRVLATELPGKSQISYNN